MKTVVLISTRLQSHMHHETLEQWRKNARAYYFVVMYCSRIIHLQTPRCGVGKHRLSSLCFSISYHAYCGHESLFNELTRVLEGCMATV